MTGDGLARLSDAALRDLAAALAAGRLSPPFTALAVRPPAPAALAAAVADDLSAFGDAADAAVRLLLTDRERRSTADPAEVVTSGPGGTGRATAAVVRQLFAEARSNLLVVGYAVHQGRDVFGTLAARLAGPDPPTLTLCLDVRRAPGDAAAEEEVVARFAGRFLREQWPDGIRPPPIFYDPRSLATGGAVVGGKRSALHAKCVVADRTAAFVSSANFTEAAQERNIELGILLRDRAVAGGIVEHFRALIDGGVLLRLPMP